MELREFAERVLMGTTLEEKLLLSPKTVSDYTPGKALNRLDLPGRPEDLVMSARDSRAAFPGLKHLENEHERGKMLHFLANHELLATELMALVLLKFPDAPKEFRMGVFQTLKEEQAHTLMYMRRMQECGVQFGSLPVNDYFWRMVSPMEQPLDFVTRLSLTFEQANLDFSKHYANLFRQVGDTSTASVLEKIYIDEIEHVGHGLKWFKQWKQVEQSDWNAYKTQLNFPLTPSKAKGVAPFNTEGRIAAGLDPDFIARLEAEEGSRGRTPTVHLFNPNAEGYAIAAQTGKSFTPKKAEQILESDLEMLPLAWAKKDDVVLVKNIPSIEHLSYLRRSGIQLPEWVSVINNLKDRKLGGFSPWAWSPDASIKLKKYAKLTTNKGANCWREPLPVVAFSKELGQKLLLQCQPEEKSYRCDSLQQLKKVVEEMGVDVLLKAPFSSAGRGHRKFLVSEGWVKTVELWAENIIHSQGCVIAEPFLDRVFDFSSQYEVRADGSIKHIGITRVLNDASGRYLGTFVHPKWASGLDSDLTQWLFREAQVVELYKFKLLEYLEPIMAQLEYTGAFGIDAFVYKTESGYALRQIVEINTRYTMGRVALDLLKSSKAIAGFYQIIRLSKLKESNEEWISRLNMKIQDPTVKYGSIVLNDPCAAREFLAVWHARNSWAELSQDLEIT